MLLYRVVMETHYEQHTAFKFCFKLGMNGADMYKMMKLVYSDAEWSGRFRKGCESEEDEARVGHPHTS